MTQSVDELLAAARKEKPKTQEESNKIIIETIEKMSPEDRKMFIYDGIKSLEKNGTENALSIAAALKKHFVRH